MLYKFSKVMPLITLSFLLLGLPQAVLAEPGSVADDVCDGLRGQERSICVRTLAAYNKLQRLIERGSSNAKQLQRAQDKFNTLEEQYLEVIGVPFINPPMSACQSSAGFGMATVESTEDFNTTKNALNNAIVNQGNFTIDKMAIVDHQKNAADVEIVIPANTLFLARNTSMATTPQLQANGTVSLDLPQKLLVWQLPDVVCVGYTTSEYIDARHYVGVDSTISDALAGIATLAAGNNDLIQPSQLPVNGAGIITVESSNNFDITVGRLQQALDTRPVFSLITYNWQAETGGAITPNQLTIFGNATLGSQLIDQSPTIGIDLPLKIVVREDANGTVQIVANDINYLADRHGVSNNATVDTIFMAVNGIISEVAASPVP